MHINVNQRSPTIDEILGERGKSIEVLLDRTVNEIKFDLQLVCSQEISASKLKQWYSAAKDHEYKWYNNDSKFKEAVNCVLNPETKQAIITEYVMSEVVSASRALPVLRVGVVPSHPCSSGKSCVWAISI